MSIDMFSLNKFNKLFCSVFIADWIQFPINWVRSNLIWKQNWDFLTVNRIKASVLNIEILPYALSAKPTEWSNTLRQFVSKLPTNCLSVFDHFVMLCRVKWVNDHITFISISHDCCQPKAIKIIIQGKTFDFLIPSQRKHYNELKLVL